ncbi:MAG TPA: PHB depolymerase family esterase [Polyangia bacterium]|jgi:poly(hydroxyalkanoate) depolymerase family esterase
MSSRSNNGRLSILALRLAATAALSASLLVGASASAQTPVSGNWSGGTTEPSYISMYEYVPSTLATNPPILVVIHYCGGNASGIWGEASGNGGTSTSIKSKVDSEGILVVLPQLNGRNCWDVGTSASLTHASGTASGGDTKAIVDMVNYEISTRHANASRVYAVGSSSGAMMTEALLAVYPDVFKGGAEFAGVPAGCWSDQYASSNQWSGPCAGGTDTMTAQAWGDLARKMDPSYTAANGLRPRIQLWHGSADTTISPVNQAQAILQWTNVMGLPTNPDMTTSVTIGGHTYSRQQWKDPTCSSVIQLDAWTESNGPHGTDANMNGQYSLQFMNLDTTPFAASDPQAACSSSSTGSGGSTGSSGGTTGSSGGTTGSSGGTTGSSGGTTGSSGGTTGSSGGATGKGGNSGAAGASATGSGGNSGSGSGGSNNTTGSGGNNSSGSGGTMVTGSGGNSSSGSGGNSSSGSGGNSSSGSGGDSSSGSGGDNSSSGSGGDNSGSGGNASGETTPAGCACNIDGTPSAFNLLALGIFGVMFSRRRAKRSAK